VDLASRFLTFWCALVSTQTRPDELLFNAGCNQERSQGGPALL